MTRLLENLVRNDSGQDMIEYAMVAAIIGLSLIAVMRAYNTDIKGVFNWLGVSLTNSI